MDAEPLQNGSGSYHPAVCEIPILTDCECDARGSINDWDTPESISVNQECMYQDEKLEPLAVIGFSLKLPQEGTTPEAFWKMLMNRKCAMTEWPRDRLNIDAFYHPDNSRPDTVQYSIRLASALLKICGTASIQRWPFP